MRFLCVYAPTHKLKLKVPLNTADAIVAVVAAIAITRHVNQQQQFVEIPQLPLPRCDAHEPKKQTEFTESVTRVDVDGVEIILKF